MSTGAFSISAFVFVFGQKENRLAMNADGLVTITRHP